MTVEGRLNQCVVLSEAPAGWGFGQAAVATAHNFWMKPMTRDGQPVSGSKINIPIVFDPHH